MQGLSAVVCRTMRAPEQHLVWRHSTAGMEGIVVNWRVITAFSSSLLQALMELWQGSMAVTGNNELVQSSFVK